MSRTAKALAINLAGGQTLGIAIGYASVAIQFNTFLTECDRYQDEAACAALPHTTCVWLPGGAPATNGTESTDVAAPSTGICAYAQHDARCDAFSADTCPTIDGDCIVSYDDKAVGTCGFTHGWTAWQQTTVAAALMIGASACTPLSAPLLDRLGRRLAIAVIGLMGLLGTATMTAGNAAAVLPLLVAGYALAGAAVGMVSAAAPMFADEICDPRWKSQVDIAFQLSCTFGNVVTATLGLVLDPSADLTGDHHLGSRMHWLHGVTFLSFLALPIVAAAAPESPLWLRQRGGDSGTSDSDYTYLESDNQQGGAAKSLSGDEAAGLEAGLLLQRDSSVASSGPGAAVAVSAFRRRRMEHRAGCWSSGAFADIPAAAELAAGWPSMAAGVLLAAATGMTGICAIINFAPRITAKLGLRPMVGALLTLIWNFLATAAALGLSGRMEKRRRFVAGVAAMTAGCFLVGTSTFPGVIDQDTVRHALGGVGILVFIAAFELGAGPSFYALAFEVFPVNLRSFGCAMTNWCFFAANLTMAFYPVLQQALSGGPGGNQNRGQALCFFMFGAVGVACSAALYLLLIRMGGRTGGA